MSKVYTLWSTRVVPSTAVEISCTSIRAYAWRAVIFVFSDVKFCRR